MKKLYIFTILLAASGCITNRPDSGYSYDDQHIVEAYKDAWESMRELPDSCEHVNDIRISSLPHESEEDDSVQGWCCARSSCSYIEACAYQMQDLIPYREYLNVIVDEDASTTLEKLVGHEVLHHLRSCWAMEARGEERRRRFNVDGVHIPYPTDLYHNDCDVWERCSGNVSIEYKAWQRLNLAD